MKNYWRAIRIALRYRWTICGTLACSLMVAAFWGGNIGALYPVIQVAFQGRSLQSWINDEISKSQVRIDEIQTSIVEINKGLPGNTTDATKLKTLQFELAVERRILTTRQRLLPVVHRFLPHDPFQTVVAIVLGLVLATMLKGLFIFGNSMCVSRLEQRVGFELRRQLYYQALRMDIGAFGKERTSGLLSRFNADIGCLTTGIKNLFGSAIREPLKMLACLIGASIISWRLLLFSLILTPLVALLIRKLAGSIKRANRRVLEEVTQLYGVLTETFNGIQTVQAYTLEQYERTKFHRVSKEWLQKAMKIAFYSSLTKPLTETMGIGVISLALISGAYLTLNQQTHLLGIRMCDRPMDVPSLLVFFGLLIGTTEPARKLSEIFNSIQAGLAASDRLFPLLDLEPRIVSPKSPQPIPRPHRRLVFENVDFRYVPDVPVLTEVSLTVDFGETIAIVGPNGCGKTTLMQLIPRFFDPTGGAIKLDSTDLRNVRLRELRQRIGIVTQQSVLFDDTVYNNIRSGKMDASEMEIMAAAQKARAHRFVTDKLAHGYQTRAGVGGNRLSGGQRQRIALARAIIRDPEILILDEATSQIDIESEQLIHQALEEFARDRTVFVITHRMSTLALANRILVMNAGRVQDVGTHDELVSRCEFYQRLHALPFQRSA